MKHVVLAVLLVGGAAPGSAELHPAGSELPLLEQALLNEPDDLRAGSEYRMAIIRAGQYDRALAFFQTLVAAHPAAANAHLNFGFVYVDKIPVAGAITKVILADHALSQFSRSLQVKPSWIAYYTRGNSYLFWPRIFKRTHLAVADLEEALKMQRAAPRRSYHVRTYVALGDGYWKQDQADKADAVWREGLAEFPNDAALKARLARRGGELEAIIDASYDRTQRVESSLRELWAEP